MAASRSSRVTRSSVGLNGLDENFCGRTLRNRSIAQPEETPVSPPPRARSPKKRQDSKQEKADAKPQEQDAKPDAKLQEESKQEAKVDGEPDREEKVADSNTGSRKQWTVPNAPRHEPSPPPPPPDMNNSPINNNSNSGDASPAPSPAHPEPNECNATFTELYEHRYTLRTPPKTRANGDGKTSPGPPSEISEVGASEEVQDGGDDDEEADSPMEEDITSKQEEPALKTEEEEEEDEEEEEPDVYYFESDHLALKHNKDYQRLLQTIGVLEAQRTQAVLDLETLSRHQRDALDDPISFVEQLQKQVNLGMPCPQRVVQLPDISWEQYTSGLGDFEREFCDKKRKTRQLQLIFDKGLPLRPKSPIEAKKEGESSSMYVPLPMSDAPDNSRQTQQIIRGRICHPNKSDTFNQLWTVDEQKKLEQLLMKFPPEEVESRRWQKIADELGNRTAKQVASRVQKYFIKLTKAGIPVPGRIPNLCMYTKKASTKRQHHLNKHLYRPSTFMASYEPPVFMDEDDERNAYYGNSQDQAADESDEEVPMELRTLPEYKELLELKRLKKQKLQEIQDDQTNFRHVGFKCDMCGTEPIQGVRWHCQDCPPDNSVDFCSNCSDCLFKTDTHRPSHHLEPVTAGYNYLDPNYFPANR
uniref:ZZ-type zinc finger-containing protein 3 n=1 Tax=Neogobius melanostomus TaxID=47308 RepID=A0A8C6TK67_9GOBI